MLGGGECVGGRGECEWGGGRRGGGDAPMTMAASSAQQWWSFLVGADAAIVQHVFVHCAQDAKSSHGAGLLPEAAKPRLAAIAAWYRFKAGGF